MTEISGIVVRKARYEDVQPMLDIYRPYVQGTAITFEYAVPTIDEFTERLAKTTAKYPWLVAEVDKRVVGFAYASTFKDREAYRFDVETTIYVDEGSHLQGIGRALYEALERELHARGVVNMYACVATAPTFDKHLPDASLRFHERMGFKPVGTFKHCGIKFDTWYDITWYEKSLSLK